MNGIDATEHDLRDRLMLVPEMQGTLRVAEVKMVRRASTVADGNAIYAIGDLFIILVSPMSFPNVAAEEAGAIKVARARLPPHLSSLLIDIVVEGRLDDNRSFAVMPRGRPLSEKRLLFALQKRLVTPIVLEWLRGLAREPTPPSEDVRGEFKLSLEALAAIRALPSLVTAAAKEGLDRLLNGDFAPRLCPMHGDLWKGNIIFAPDKSIKIIDWRGSRMRGYGIFDLIKFGQSFKISDKKLYREIASHAQSLGLDATGAFTTLLAACGHIYRNLEEFPLERFVGMTESLCASFRAAVPELSDHRGSASGPFRD